MAVPRDALGVGSALQRHSSRSLQRRLSVEHDIVIGDQVLHRGHRLRVHLDPVQDGADVPQGGVVHVGGDDDRNIVPPHSRILGGGVGIGGLDGSQPQPVAVHGGGVEENLPQRPHLGVVIGIAEDGLAVLLELPGGDSENLVFGSPAQDEGGRRISSVGQRSGRLGDAGEVDIAARQDLVLDQPGAAAQCHLIHLAFLERLDLLVHLGQRVLLAVLQERVHQVPPGGVPLGGGQLVTGEGGGCLFLLGGGIRRRCRFSHVVHPL